MTCDECSMLRREVEELRAQLKDRMEAERAMREGPSIVFGRNAKFDARVRAETCEHGNIRRHLIVVPTRRKDGSPEPMYSVTFSNLGWGDRCACATPQLHVGPRLFVDLHRYISRGVVMVKLMHWPDAKPGDVRLATDYEDFWGEVRVITVDPVKAEIYLQVIEEP